MHYAGIYCYRKRILWLPPPLPLTPTPTLQASLMRCSSSQDRLRTWQKLLGKARSCNGASHIVRVLWTCAKHPAYTPNKLEHQGLSAVLNEQFTAWAISPLLYKGNNLAYSSCGNHRDHLTVGARQTYQGSAVSVCYQTMEGKLGGQVAHSAVQFIA